MAASVNNYYIGKGICSWKPDGGAYRDLGNVTAVSLNLTAETLEHFSSRGGTREKDLTVTISKAGTVTWTMDEITLENMAFAVMGEIAVNASGQNYLEIFELSKLTGSFRFVGTNDVGRNIRMELLKVEVLPGAALPLISDEFGTLEITGQVSSIEGSGWGTIVDLNSSSGGSG
jgi:hypothetical protein